MDHAQAVAKSFKALNEFFVLRSAKKYAHVKERFITFMGENPASVVHSKSKTTHIALIRITTQMRKASMAVGGHLFVEADSNADNCDWEQKGVDIIDFEFGLLSHHVIEEFFA